MKNLTFNHKVFSQHLFFTMYLKSTLFYRLNRIFKTEFSDFFENDLNDILDFTEKGNRIYYI